MKETTESRITDEVLGSYLDGELDADAARRLEARLALDAAARARLEALRKVSGWVGESVRRARAVAAAGRPPQAEEPLPFAARVVSLPGARAVPPRRRPRRAMAFGLAGAFAAGMAFAAGVLLLLGVVPRHSSSWEDHALAFHESYLASLEGDKAFPLDARTSDPVALGESLDELVGWNLEVPDLSDHGYTLEGARLITTAQGPVAYLLYSSENEPLLGFAVLQSAAAPERETLHVRGSLHLLEWSDGQNSFGLGGTHSPDLLRSLAVAVQHAPEAISVSAGPVADGAVEQE
ncbi:MAG TPA: hypothetical protein VFV10_09500 [Gammaproteobacteria bacterium]|nr:hypothetical protein [Gammaproteobacteria bacterium]